MDSLVGEGSVEALDGIPVDILRVVIVAIGNRRALVGRLDVSRRDMSLE